MKREDMLLILAIVGTSASVVGAFFTACIALELNHKMACALGTANKKETR